MQGDRDEIVPPALGRRLFDADAMGRARGEGIMSENG
jgi:hypothetical protein